MRWAFDKTAQRTGVASVETDVLLAMMKMRLGEVESQKKMYILDAKEKHLENPMYSASRKGYQQDI